MADRGLLGCLLGLTALTGCSMAPQYHPPTIAAPLAYKEAGPWVSAQSNEATIVSGQWWTIFDDAKLDGLEQQIETGNPTLEAALGRYDAAKAYLTEARSDLFPHIGVNGTLSRNRQSDNRPLRGANQPDLYAAETVGGVASYDVDLWGRIRDGVAARRADAEASRDDLSTVRLSLEGQLASSYVTLRGYDREIELLDATVQAYAKADAMTQRRFAGGIANGMETGQSGTQLAEAQAQLADLRNARALTEHAIASLIGLPASGFSIVSEAIALSMPQVPVGLPSTLLQRRPDIAAAEQRMFAANRRIGVAKAAFFPVLSLDGSGGWQSTMLSNLVSAPNIFWSLGPSIAFSIFDGGRHRAHLAEAKASWTQATADYRGRVLGAMQEVEDGLSRLHHLGDEATAETRAVEQAAQVERLSLNRYQKGAVNYLDVVTAQTTALRTRRQSIQLATRRLQASIGLIRAVGGGWQTQAAAPSKTARQPG
ncbi:MAG TPA: efflux transporter outer membrane subunit [Sphingobium sp.]|uniref:efflux transporter outer membrane subunit n=1 Tax=Sphingobium sp. TaxID=1912891 RepID=UPI002ED06A0F